MKKQSPILMMILSFIAIAMVGQSDDLVIELVISELSEDSNFRGGDIELSVSDRDARGDNNHSIYYLQQRIDNIPVYNAMGVAVVDSKSRLKVLNHKFLFQGVSTKKNFFCII